METMSVTLQFLVSLAGCLTTVSSYPNGMVEESCNNMLPNHGNYVPNPTASPYSITVSKNTFLPGEDITVTIKSKPENSGFYGFLLEARTVGGDWITGTFTITDVNTQTLTCSAGPRTAVSHISNNRKKSITTTWTAPKGSGPVKFRATVVSSYRFFWAGIESETLVSLQISSSTCGSQKFCLTDPPNCSPEQSNCTFVSLVPITDGYVFEMSAPTLGYVATGLSDDQKMGNDDIYICTRTSSGLILVQQAYTTGAVAPSLKNKTTQSSIVTSYVDGALRCSFITSNSIEKTTLGSDYYIFLAKGPSEATGQIQQHKNRPIISSEKVDLLTFDSGKHVEEPEIESPVFRAHGALMLIAWMTTGSIGMMMARYMRIVAEQKFHDRAIWFEAHVILMVLSVGLTIIAFIMAFAEEAGWCADAGAHPVLGCIVMILSLLQPFAALFRPNPESERRVIFNVGHSICALVIKILSVATIFLGLRLMDKTPHQWMPKVMAGFFAWEVIFWIILETNTWLKTKDMKINGYRKELKAPVETIAIFTFIGGNVIFLFALLVGIGQS